MNLSTFGNVLTMSANDQSSISNTIIFTSRPRESIASFSSAARSESLHVAAPTTKTWEWKFGEKRCPGMSSENPARATESGDRNRPIVVLAVSRETSSLASRIARPTSSEKSKKLMHRPRFNYRFSDNGCETALSYIDRAGAGTKRQCPTYARGRPVMLRTGTSRQI